MCGIGNGSYLRISIVTFGALNKTLLVIQTLVISASILWLDYLKINFWSIVIHAHTLWKR